MKKTSKRKNMALRIGVVGCTALTRRIPRATRGTLVCTCGATGLQALYEGGVCASCHVPEVIDPASYTEHVEKENGYAPMTPETIALQGRYLAACKAGGLTRRASAKQLGMSESMLYQWLNGHHGPKATAKIALAVENWLPGLAEVAA